MKDDLSGIAIDTDTVWVIEGSYDLAGVLRALPWLVPADSTLYFEGTAMDEAVSALLARFPAAHATEVFPGTILPEPRRFHVAFREELIGSLILLSKQLAEPELCDHFHVYRGGRVLLAGYDFVFMPLVLPASFPEEAVREFAVRIGCAYRLRPAAET